MTDFETDEDSQVAVFRQARIRQNLKDVQEGIAGWHALRELLKQKGALAHGKLAMGRIARSCLQLGQISAVVDGDVAAALRHFSCPVDLQQPTFKEIAGLVSQGIAGGRAWDGVRLSLESELERMLCFLLAGRVEALGNDYAACGDMSLFEARDQERAAPFMNWQIYFCATGQYGKVSFADFYKKQGQFKKSEFAFGYELLLAAVARGDGDEFGRELAVREAAFGLRQRSRRSVPLWGYGYEGRDAFDVFGSALCRLAHRRGMSFPVPSARFYPPTFWLG